MMAEYK